MRQPKLTHEKRIASVVAKRTEYFKTQQVQIKHTRFCLKAKKLVSILKYYLIRLAILSYHIIINLSIDLKKIVPKISGLF
jgi:hypothetical protein